ncbi:hypothetical protein LTR99_010519 [Exophiala xenobiotica]|uniref:Uncharacterized protein n=1 Tax=Vermiconidia calcicola TaxID=1690605 RepID=A0AAV9PT69_9PEZI|nr:hypothetical protein LTR96_006977 [Exophiala xenobiotica]KAK5292375.1 hypothetical protein LTR99_010519 [Exophiala xenobiotica]KAK5427266.1 hypothetical protein LTR34_009275 [Exophiala xenobiotica]KAK5528676.1 hypothetical protein LTR25_010289 [Vermiconidia calcicola]KAK5546100.1 hypothetical protein LTR23_003907 [Chaetothyriales sp. CCFEE 6169]
MSLRHKASRQRAALENPFVFHAQIANAAGSRLHLIPPENESVSLLRQVKAYHERRSFQAIAHCLENTPGSPPDAVILALTLMIWPAGSYDASTSRYPVSPLTYGQNLDFFSNMNLSPTIIQQIHNFYRLLETRGGIDGLALVGQKHIVSFADTVVSSRLGVRPLWPWPNQLLSVLEAFADLVLDPHAFQLSSVMGRGFSPVQDVNLQRILSLACRLTLALDLFHRDAPMGPPIWQLCPVRNAVQHQLCAVDPPTDPRPSQEEAVDNMVRLATLIYSDFVLFPINEAMGVRPRLAYDLRKALEYLDTHPQSAVFVGWRGFRERELLTWCITMGAMASESTVHQEWYIPRLAQALREDQRLLDWILFHTLMEHFLWWDYVLQPRCWEVWSEAARMLSSAAGVEPATATMPTTRYDDEQ